MDRWKGKVAVITGASIGIGAAIAEKLCEKGIIVVGLARSKDKMEELSQKLNKVGQHFHPYVTDVTKEEDILAAFDWTTKTLGPIHILVNNAGILRLDTGLTDGRTDQWRETFDVNVFGLCICTREAIKNMKENNVDGHVIHINSIGGHKIYSGSQIYSASKYAVTALTEILRQELNEKSSKIKITSVSPGLVRTNILNAAIANSQTQFPNKVDQTDHQFLEPEDVADSVLYILSTPPHVQIHEMIIKPVGELF